MPSISNSLADNFFDNSASSASFSANSFSNFSLLDVKFGTVDNDWRGNSGIIVQNPTPFSYIIIPNSRLAQGVIVEKKRAVFDIKSSKDELSKTERGENGFGKSGLM